MSSTTFSFRAILSTGIFCSVILSGCGGGGGGNSDPDPSTPDAPPTQQVPIVNAGIDNTVNELTVVNLTGTASDSDGSISSTSWAQIDGPSVTINNASALNANFTAPDVSVNTLLTFEFTATDNDGLSSSDSVVITVSNSPNTPPVATAGADQTVAAQESVSLSGSGSDIDGSVVSYQWNQTSGTPVTINNADQSSANFVAPDLTTSEVIVFEFIVTDNVGATAIDSIAITVTVPMAGTQVIAATGLPAADFPDGYIYWSVSNPSIGANGHIAFWGQADVSIGSTDQNTGAVWAGLPSHLKVIARENNQITGLPSNVLFDKVYSSTRTPPPVVAPNGSVAFVGALKGAVTDANKTVLFAHVNGQLYPALRTGNQAPGLPSGVVIKDIRRFEISDFGLVVNTIIATNNFIAEALWLWTPTETKLITVADIPLINLVDVPEERVTISGINCQIVRTNFFQPLNINDLGQVAFAAELSPINNGEACPSYSLFRWQAGILTPIISYGAAVPGMANAELRPATLLSSLQLGPQGEIAFSSYMAEGANLAVGNWVAYPDGSLELIAMSGEQLPPDFSTTSLYFGILGLIPPRLNGNGNYVVAAIESGTNYPMLLRGNSRGNTYSSLTNTGASPLQLVVKQGDIPPGFSSTHYFSDLNPFDDLWETNSEGDVVFSATRADALVPNQQTLGIWQADIDNNLEEILAIGDTLTSNGVESTVTHIFFRDTDDLTNDGHRLSDTGQYIVETRLSTAYQAIVLINP